MSTRPTYTVQATRDGKWWALRCPEVPGALSQARRLDQADEMIRDAISLVLEIDPESFDINVRAVLDGGMEARLAELERLREECARMQEQLSQRVRDLAQQLASEDLPQRDVGELLSLSHQRVSQLLAGEGAAHRHGRAKTSA